MSFLQKLKFGIRMQTKNTLYLTVMSPKLLLFFINSLFLF